MFRRLAPSALRLAIVIAILLVMFRSFAPLWYEQLDFDSDQAIVGLMAKHLSELRHFPLFFYGQNYMLGVQSWIAVPFFWIGGPTLLMLRLPLAIINAAVATTVIVMFWRRGVRPGLAFVSALPLIVATPVVSTGLLQTLGASIEPFAYILVLWVLRRRPLAFGALLCVGTLHREFTILVVPALVIGCWVEGRRIHWPSVARGGMAFAAVWLLVDLLKWTLGGGSLTQEADTIGSWMTSSVGGYLARMYSLVTVGLPELVGGHAFPLSAYGMNSTIVAGSLAAGLAFAVAVVVSAGRVLWILRGGEDRARFRAASFQVYLGCAALGTFAVYGLNDGIDPLATPVLRYFLFGLLLPVGLFGMLFAMEGARSWRTAVVSPLVVWAALTLWDNVRLVREYRTSAPAGEFRALADYLVAHQIDYGRAGYWDCYVVDFFARERVILASTDVIRIPEYQVTVDQHAASAVVVERTPCTSGAVFASWCIEDPLKRVGGTAK
jgi:hypothetical protein